MAGIGSAIASLFITSGTAAGTAAGTTAAVAGTAAAAGGAAAGLTPLSLALIGSGAGFGLSQLAKPKMPNINVPPPPGAAMIDQAGVAANASERARAAAAGGLASTVTGAGQGPLPATSAPSLAGATSGAKQTLG